jgi:hypothetical protein
LFYTLKTNSQWNINQVAKSSTVVSPNLLLKSVNHKHPPGEWENFKLIPSVYLLTNPWSVLCHEHSIFFFLLFPSPTNYTSAHVLLVSLLQKHQNSHYMTHEMLKLKPPCYFLEIISPLHFFNSAYIPSYLKDHCYSENVPPFPQLYKGISFLNSLTQEDQIESFYDFKHSQRWTFSQHWSHLSSLKYISINVHLLLSFLNSKSLQCMKSFSNPISYIRVHYKIANSSFSYLQRMFTTTLLINLMLNHINNNSKEP